MKVSTEIDNNFGYEKITQLVDNIPLTMRHFEINKIILNRHISHVKYLLACSIIISPLFAFNFV